MGPEVEGEGEGARAVNQDAGLGSGVIGLRTSTSQAVGPSCPVWNLPSRPGNFN